MQALNNTLLSVFELYHLMTALRGKFYFAENQIFTTSQTII